jgi:hypothetical protein
MSAPRIPGVAAAGRRPFASAARGIAAPVLAAQLALATFGLATLVWAALAAPSPDPGALPENRIGAPAVDLAPAPARPAEPPAEPPVPAAAPAARPTTAPAGNPLWALPLRALKATRERPLFSPSRRPPAPAVAAPLPPPPPPAPPPAEPDRPALALIGTIVTESGGIGIFLDEGTRDVVRLRPGQDRAGWVLRTVRPREATFDNGGRSATLALPPRDQEQADAAPGLPPPAAVAGSPGESWMDGDGQMIAPPPRRPIRPPAAAPEPGGEPGLAQ